jgi:thiamine-monophosphate kinase
MLAVTSELAFIESLRALARDPAARNLDDDCAVLQIGSETLILTHDMMAQGAHFRADADMADVAWKLVAVNLSDLSAKGAEPLGVLLGYSLGDHDARFVEGLGAALKAFDVPLLGGDTVRAPGARCFGLTAIGRASHVPVPDRRKARAGETVWVTGTLGRAMLGFEGQAEHLAAFNRPHPLLAEGKALAPHVGAMMDVSDGLLLDCWRMARASGVTIALDSHAVPVADPARREECLRWGDDYELLFTLPAGIAPPVPATAIGGTAMRAEAPLIVDGAPITSPDGLGYRH